MVKIFGLRGIARIGIYTVMEFEFDKQKSRSNKEKHGIDFMDVPSMFQHPMVMFLDQRKDYGEDRRIGTGILKTILTVVVFAEPNDETTRIISSRKATKHEEQIYRDEI